MDSGQITRQVLRPISFEKIEKGRNYNTGLTDRIRLTPKSLQFGSDITARWNRTRSQRPAGMSVVRLAVEVSPRDQAFKIYEDALGFTTTIFENGSGQMSLPSGLRKAGMPTGDYLPVEGDHSVFVLAK